MTLVGRGALGAVLLLLLGCRSETHDERRMRMWKEDFKACDKFASDRYKARELLAYDPEDYLRKSPEQRLADSEQRLRNVETDMGEKMQVWKFDRHACLRGQLWTDESIEELEQKYKGG